MCWSESPRAAPGIAGLTLAGKTRALHTGRLGHQASVLFLLWCSTKDCDLESVEHNEWTPLWNSTLFLTLLW